MVLQHLEHVANVDGLPQERRQAERSRLGFGVRSTTGHDHDGKVFEAVVRELFAAEVVAVHLRHGEVEHHEAGADGMLAKVVEGRTAIRHRDHVDTHDGSEVREGPAGREVIIRQEHVMTMLGPAGNHIASTDIETESSA
jgi:hypothetical protein